MKYELAPLGWGTAGLGVGWLAASDPQGGGMGPLGTAVFATWFMCGAIGLSIGMRKGWQIGGGIGRGRLIMLVAIVGGPILLFFAIRRPYAIQCAKCNTESILSGWPARICTECD
ncbi:MAG: hypothetical protein U1E26_12725 [Coriobacteriia bacterium]|nr:hypothetical protein [Coriobacteriia bacterium]